MSIFEYLLYPNLGTGSYTSTNVMILLGSASVMIVLSVASKFWRKKQKNSIARKLSKSWSASLAWFGIFGFFLAVSRVEGVSYVSMRIWTIVWALCFVAFLVVQILKFKNRYYEVIPQEKKEDPNDRYLPKKKK